MKKIMFNDKYGLTQAVLEGRKTMTRRIISKNHPISINGKLEPVVPLHVEHGRLVLGKEDGSLLLYAPLYLNPKYKIGEVVAVAQNLKDMGYNPRDTKHRSGEIWGLDHCAAWTNKMFVCASECKYHIRITNVRVEQLQDISDEDCLREGIERIDNDHESMYKAFNTKGGFVYSTTPKGAFAALIDKISGIGTWESDPYCFVYEFELIK